MAAKLTTREAFLESVLHGEHIIMGRTMLPFCLEMWCILEALESPLIAGGKIEIEDLQLAIIACSTPSTTEFYRLTRRPSFAQKCWKLITCGQNTLHVLYQFNQYIEDYLPQFPLWDSSDGFGHEFKCPELFIIAAKLFRAGHSDQDISRNVPLGKLLSWRLAIEEGKGDPLDIIQSDREMEALAQLEKQA